MRIYSFDELPDIKNVDMDGDIRGKDMPGFWVFLKDALKNNFFTRPITNILYLLAFVAAILMIINGVNHAAPIKLLVVVLLLRGVLVYSFVRQYNSFKRAGAFPVVTAEGVTYMLTVDNEGEMYLRMYTMKWEDVKTLRVYKNFVTVQAKKERSEKDDVDLVYIWADNIPLLKRQILYLWKNALAPRKDKSPVVGPYSIMDNAEVSEYIVKTFGEYEQVFHEIVSTDIHIDVALIPPQEGRNYCTLCTIGAVGHRMDIPYETRVRNRLTEYAEYMMYLPADWKFDEESLKDEKNYWPLRLLKTVARMPMWTGDWMTAGHTVGSEDGEPFSEDKPFNTALLAYPAPDFSVPVGYCNLSSGKSVVYYQVIPIDQDEYECIQENGVNEFLEDVLCENDDVIEAMTDRIEEM